MSETYLYAKQVIVLRKDLNMRKGKMVAQGAHASMAVLLNNGKLMRHLWGEDNESSSEFVIPLSYDDSTGSGQCFSHDALIDWIEGAFTKIAVSVNSEQELLDLHKAAKEAGLLCSLIRDSGKTEFGGVPTHTAIAIGPGWNDDIDKITGHLPLL